ncbi:hypothetical protein [Paracidovorax cattleyae]|uniref:hypothetical protein n=1 Tax=Paracidovorax cattleyae TaxID=80868 RepID=UPI0018AFCEE8|nr:hypothetical protein [Paracidovorax cattleyae]MBF9263432.1 hypothetical protein [Paracidovorax cattleyae]
MKNLIYGKNYKVVGVFIVPRWIGNKYGGYLDVSFTGGFWGRRSIRRPWPSAARCPHLTSRWPGPAVKVAEFDAQTPSVSDWAVQALPVDGG